MPPPTFSPRFASILGLPKIDSLAFLGIFDIIPSIPFVLRNTLVWSRHKLTLKHRMYRKWVHLMTQIQSRGSEAGTVGRHIISNMSRLSSVVMTV